jgi:phenylacetic acid degradation protein
MSFFSIEGIVPVVDPTSFVHPTAVLIGDVLVGPRCYIGPLASLRGDFGRIIVEDGANIQDNCVIHTFPGEQTFVGSCGHIGHGAVLHGCRLMPNVLIGMNATVMDGATIGESSVVAAMSFVKAGFQVPPRTLVAGIPAKILKTLDEQEIAAKSSGTRLYQRLAERCLASLTEVQPLSRADAVRLEVRHRADGGAV